MVIESILLTAGRSSRMGQDKSLLKIGKISVIEHILLKLIPLSESITIVVGENHEMIEDHLLRSALNLDNVCFAVNQNAQLGMYSSIRKGCSKVSGNNPVLLQMIDQPFVSKNTLQTLIKSIDAEHLIFQPSINIDGLERIGHPILFSPDFIKEISADNDKGNLRDLIRKFSHKRKFVPLDDENILQNINTPQQFEKSLKKIVVDDIKH